jgi:HK97 family phage major capsid protein
MATLDEAIAKIAELTTAIQEKNAAGQDPKTALQWDDVSKQFETQLNALVAVQVAEKLAAMPQRRVAGDPILSADALEHLQGNRYAKMVRDFEKDGAHKFGGQTLKPVDLLIAALMMEGQVKHYHAGFGGAPVTMSEDLRKALKAMDSTTAGAGDELVPTNMAAQLWDDFFLASRVVGLMQRIDMPTNPFDVPLGLGEVTWRKGSENAATTASNPTTAKSTLTATELVTEQGWSYTLDEDAVIAMAPAIRARLAQSGAEIMDAFALNADSTDADTGNINSDDGNPANDSYYLSAGQDGIRHQWLVDAATAMGRDEAGTLEDATIIAEMGAMGKYAIDPNQLVFFSDINTYLGGFLSTATGAPGNNVITMDKFGAGAVVLTGQLAAYRGVPIVVSASHPLGEADGKVSTTAASNTKGSLSIVNRMMWYLGFRRQLLIEVDRDIQRRQYIMVTSLREAIAAHGTRSTATHTGGLFNITV